MAITDRAIDQAFSDLKKICGGVRNDYFGLLYLEQEFGVTRDRAIAQVAYVAASALRFMDHLPESKVSEMFGRVSAWNKSEPVDVSGPPTLFDTTTASTGRLTSR